MNSKSIYLFILSLSIIFYFVVFALEINIADLIGDKFKNILHKLHIETFQLKPILLEKQSIKIEYPPLKPLKISDANEYTRPELMNMSILYNNKETRLMAANEDIEEESPADFGNQQTNISEFVQMNKGRFFTDGTTKKGPTMQPNEWELKGTVLFNKILNDRTVQVEPFDEKNYSEL